MRSYTKTGETKSKIHTLNADFLGDFEIYSSSLESSIIFARLVKERCSILGLGSLLIVFRFISNDSFKLVFISSEQVCQKRIDNNIRVLQINEQS